MANESPLPTKTEVEKLYNALLGPDEDMDETAAAAILDEQGVDPLTLVADFQKRLESEVQSLEAQNKTVPPALLDALASLRAYQSGSGESDTDTPAWLDALLNDMPDGNFAEDGSSSHLLSFRGRSTTSVSPKDQEILDALAAELDAERR